MNKKVLLGTVIVVLGTVVVNVVINKRKEDKNEDEIRIEEATQR